MRIKKKILSLFALLLAFTMSIGGITAFAYNPDTPLGQLQSAVKNGKYEDGGIDYNIDVSEKMYKQTGGGYTMYLALMSGDADKFVNTAAYDKLTSNEQQNFIKDMLSIAQNMADYTDSQNRGDAGSVTTETVDDFLEILTNELGVGSAILSALLKDVKPNYGTAMSILSPFSGAIGTFMAIGAILILTLLGASIVLDMAFICIPPFQLFLMPQGASGPRKEDGGSSKIGGFVSMEAVKAVTEANGAKDGEYKSPLIIWAKRKVIQIALCCICLLYLVGGQIWGLMGKLLDLFTGFI